ncbi:hypothetical protein TRIP_C21305 [Candidatus Zixiibacteriota bacterium]|nr:hypothetical protein TRIP_C21305 [candidate division Zixibacteria bacterium]
MQSQHSRKAFLAKEMTADLGDSPNGGRGERYNHPAVKAIWYGISRPGGRLIFCLT